MLATIIQRAVMQGIPLLFGSTGEILTEKSGNLNLGIPGIMYVGGISGVIGAFFYENSLAAPEDANAFMAISIPLLCSILGSLIMGLIYCFLTVTLRANQNVTGLAITTFGVGFGNFFGGSLIKLVDTDIPSISHNNKQLLQNDTAFCRLDRLVWKDISLLRLFGLRRHYHCARLFVLPQQNTWRLTFKSCRRKSCYCRCRRYQR